MKYHKTKKQEIMSAVAQQRPHNPVGKGQLKLADVGVSVGTNVRIDLTGNVTIGNCTELYDDVRIFTHKHYWNHSRELRGNIQKVRAKDLIIDDDVFIGAGAMIVFVGNIGQGAVIGAGSVLTKDVPPYEIWAGNPAKKVGERG